MKKTILIALIFTCAATTITSCEKGNNDPIEARNEITVTTISVNTFIICLAGNGSATIDWGDGSHIETITLPPTFTAYNENDSSWFSHDYSETDATPKTITITGDIKELYTARENQTTGLDISEMPGLTILDCGREYKLTSLIIGRNSELRELNCFMCGITSLDVSRCNSLIGLDCDECPWLTTLKLGTHKDLVYLDCNECKLSSKLDVSKCSALEYLDCSGNDIPSLTFDTHNALRYLDCCNNELTKLDISKCPALAEVDCHGNALISLKLGTHNALTDLDCYDNEIKTLDVKKCPALEELLCYENALTSLTFGTHEMFWYLLCNDNKLNTLDASGCLKMRIFVCSDNALTSLIIPSNPEFELMYCENNMMDKAALKAIFSKLPDRTDSSEGAIFCGGDIYENPGYAELSNADKSIVTAKNWIIDSYRP